MSERFYVESPIGDSRTAQLVDAEAHHLVKVMRAAVGSDVTLFDGSGCEFLARVSGMGRTSVELEILQRRQVDRELPFALTLAVALPKGERQKVLVEKLVELGATSLIPLHTRRSVAEATPSALLRLRRQVIEASKQSGRNRLMQIAEPRDLQSLLREPPAGRRLLAHPSGDPVQVGQSAGATTIYIGPEGGFTEEEVTLARASGSEVASLGRRILRTETAAIALASLFAYQGQAQ
jgi:16S rRNA (uracil1498-N3)-methyltransferase